MTLTPQENLKQMAAQAALAYVQDGIIGIGTGSTVNYFIQALATVKGKFEGTVASSEMTAQLLKAQGIAVLDLNAVGEVPVYIDGADEIDPHLRLIKGGGGALTREKILAAAAKKFICIADESKYVPVLGQFPLAIEVIPMARSYVARQIVKLGGTPSYREHFVTDNGNIILDVYNLAYVEPIILEQKLNNITGIVAHGLFAQRHADIALLAGKAGVRTLT